MKFLRTIVIHILTLEARLVLARYKPRIIAVTGSVGKTSTKDAIFAAISGELHVRKSEKSFNSEIGVPLTILGCENGWRNPLLWIRNIVYGLWLIVRKTSFPQWLVIEVGADRPGDIRKVARWLRPDIAVLTGISDVPVHVEYFDSPEAVAREKRALAEYLRPGGKLILNGDDVHVRAAEAIFRGASLTYGFGADNDFCARESEVWYEGAAPVGMHFRFERAGASVPVSLRGALGMPRIYAALAALAAAEVVGVDLVYATRGLTNWKPTPGRLRILPGIKDSFIIDDTYNSSPVAALAALDTLQSLRTGGRKVAILGDMLELGKFSAEAHRTVGKRAAAVADRLLTVGFRARAIAEAALDESMKEKNIRQYELGESARAGKELEVELKAGDVILVKGSQGMRMERAVKELMAEPERADELLVRQDEEWQHR